MIIDLSEKQLNRIREKRSEEISAQFLESFETGYYEEAEATDVAIISKGRIPAAQTRPLSRPAIFVSGSYRVINIPMQNMMPLEEPIKRGSPIGGPTQSMLCVAYPMGAFEKTLPAAFPASLWINEAVDFERNGRRDRALDIVFTEMDKLLRKGDFDLCNRILELLDVDNLSPNLLIAFLTITLRAHERLPARAILYSRVEERFSNRANKDKLLSGLKGPANGPRFF